MAWWSLGQGEGGIVIIGLVGMVVTVIGMHCSGTSSRDRSGRQLSSCGGTPLHSAHFSLLFFSVSFFSLETGSPLASSSSAWLRHECIAGVHWRGGEGREGGEGGW